MTKGQAERLFPMIDETLQTAGLSLKDLDAISVATGPGNFTGVRICVSAARGLALSLGIPDMCVGFNAADIAAELGAAASSEQMPAPEIYGFIAQTKDWTSEPRPAPLYLRSPDAALPSEPAPHIIP